MISRVTVCGDVYSPQAAAAPEEAPAESAPEKPGETGEDGVPEDTGEAGGRGTGGKKEASSSKSAADGKLVKGALLLRLAGPATLLQSLSPWVQARVGLAGLCTPGWAFGVS